ncbi:hypothetical protein CNR27_05045 [Luteimonas chenhongjianii]|uniref:Trimeric autotransporter adhesin YadA-like C-terminal membrane anchor domain-containing protein n=1 Tax=Luteimonas chenhongjianii TaxID=2006110 RepID=A0A290XHV1_9GAMM|nr:hypothetical protein CNR27_05045 [Luteimonas chenhongjianii]
MGNFSTAEGSDSVALGSDAVASANGSVALGQGALADRQNSVSVGTVGAERQITNVADGVVAEGSTDAVTGSQLNQTNVRVDGVEDRIGDVENVAASAVTYDDETRSRVTLAGEDGTRLTNLARGAVSASSTDAITGGQLHGALQTTADALGGGAAVTAFGTISAPTFAIQGGNYFSVGDAFGALDAEISGLKQQVGDIDTAMRTSANRGDGAVASKDARTGAAASVTSAPATPVATPTGTDVANTDEVASAPDVQAEAGEARGGVTTTAAEDRASRGEIAGTSVESVHADSGDGSAVATVAEEPAAQGTDATADTAGSSRVSGVPTPASVSAPVAVDSAGTPIAGGAAAAPADAISADVRAYADSTATQAVSSANAYTDQRFAAFNDSFDTFKGDVERRFYDTDRRIDRQGAMGAAMLNMATSAAGIRTQNRVGVGVGFQGGESALSVGYQRAISDRATMTVGGAFSGDEKSIGVGAGFGW